MSGAPSHKRRSKKNASAQGRRQPVVKKAKADEEEYDEEIGELWKEVETRYSDPKKYIFAVVQPNQVAKMIQLTRNSKSRSKRAKIVVVSQNGLKSHEGVRQTFDKEKPAYNGLLILVCSTVKCIAYDIPSTVMKAWIVPNGNRTGAHNQLRIASESKYCGVRAYGWDHRPQDLLNSGHKIVHEEGCYFDISDDQEMAHQIIGQPRECSDSAALPAAERSLIEKRIGEIDTTTEERSEDGSWFREWAVMPSDVFRGVGAGTFAGAFWFNSAGVFVKGSFGLQLSAGLFKATAFGASGGSSARAAGATILPSALVHFIPWSRVFEYLQYLLVRIWNRVRRVLSSIYQRLMALSSVIVTSTGGSIQGCVSKPTRFRA